MRLYKIYLIVFLLLIPFSLNAAEYDSGVQARVILKTSATGNGDAVTYLKTDQPEITAMEVTIAPGAQTGWHSHSVPVYAYVLSGSLNVDIEGSGSRDFNAGDVIIEVVNTKHNGANKGNVPVKLIVFYTGAKDLPNVIK